MCIITIACVFFFFNDTATTEIYTLSLPDALPISRTSPATTSAHRAPAGRPGGQEWTTSPSADSTQDRKSTRLNSSHANISYAVFCLKKKKKLSHINIFTILYTCTTFTTL